MVMDGWVLIAIGLVETVRSIQMKSKQELLECGVASDSELSAYERETSLTFPKDRDVGYFHSEITSTIKWFLSVEDTVVEDYRTNDEGEVIAVRGKVPKTIVKLQNKSRKQSIDSQMVTYGPLKE